MVDKRGGGFHLSLVPMAELECTVIKCSRCDTDRDRCDECAAGYQLSNNQCSELLMVSTSIKSYCDPLLTQLE